MEKKEISFKESKIIYKEMDIIKEYERLVGNGYIPFQLFRDLLLPQKAIKKSSRTNSKERYYGAFFYKKNNDKSHDLRCLHFKGIEDYNYLNKKISKYIKDKTIGYELFIYCSILGIRAGYGKQFNIDKLINSFKNTKGWVVEKYEKTNTFCINFKLKKGENIEKYLNEVDNTIRILSLRNQIGIIISEHQTFPCLNNVPINFQVGLLVTEALGINKNDFEIIKNIRYMKDRKLEIAINSLREYYSQFTNITRILIGWSAIEEIFSINAKHILDKKEIGELIKLVKKCEFNTKQKQSKIIELLKKPDIFSEKNRNERIAQNISDCMDLNYNKVYGEVSDISRFRGQFAHQISGNIFKNWGSKKVKEMKRCLIFIEAILKLYIEKKSLLRFNSKDKELILKYK